MLIFTGMGEIRSFRYYAILFGSSINAFSIQGGILLANIFHAATALDRYRLLTSIFVHFRRDRLLERKQRSYLDSSAAAYLQQCCSVSV